MTAARVVVSVYALGLLHVLAASLAGWGGWVKGRRGEEVPAGGCRVPRLGWDFFAVPLTQTRAAGHTPA